MPVLAEVVTLSIFLALASLVKYIADSNDELPTMVF